jgi:N-acetylneuraminic acid mutarotase
MRNRLVFLETLVAIAVTLVVVVFGRDQVFGQGGRWTVKAPIPTPREGLAVGVVNGILYAVGGQIRHPTGVGMGDGGHWEFLSTVEAYDPSTNSWSTKTPLPTPRSGVAVGVVDGILYAVGGTGSETVGPSLTLDTMDAYDPVRNTWTARAPMPTRRYGHAVGVARGILYVVGGGTGTETGLVEAYDPITNRWTVKAPMPTPRVWPGVGVVNGILYVVGGVCCGCCEPADKILGTVEAYDPTTNTWTAKAPMLTPRAGVPVGVANQVLYVVGGFSPGATWVNLEAYDPTRNVWTTKTSLPVNWFPAGLGVVKGILYAVGGVKTVPGGPDSPRCGGAPCSQSVLDPITYAFKAVP